MLPTETPVPSDEVYEAAVAATDSGLAGLPFVGNGWNALSSMYLLLIIIWVGLIILTAYVIRITHGP